MIAVLLACCAVLAAGETPVIQTRDEVRFDDPSRPGTVVEALVFYPDGGAACPVVVFSHDLGRSRGAYWWLGERWAQAGYVAVFPTHAGSDRALLQGLGARRALAALRSAAADPQVWESRPRDLLAVVDGLDQLEERVPSLRGRLLRGSIGVAGHALGAASAQALTGMKPLVGGQRHWLYRESVVACISLSPLGVGGAIDREAFATVVSPNLLVVGGRDDQPEGLDTPAHPPEWREEGFALLPAGRTELVRIAEAHHFTFSNGGWGPSVDRRHTALLADLTTAYWDRHLRQDASADPAAVVAGQAEFRRR